MSLPLFVTDCFNPLASLARLLLWAQLALGDLNPSWVHELHGCHAECQAHFCWKHANRHSNNKKTWQLLNFGFTECIPNFCIFLITCFEILGLLAIFAHFRSSVFHSCFSYRGSHCDMPPGGKGCQKTLGSWRLQGWRHGTDHENHRFVHSDS